MKVKKNNLILVLFLITIHLYNIKCGWPTDNTPASRALPMLEVRMTPPENYMPKVQALIKKLDQQREDSQFKYMESLQEAYEKELQESGKMIKGVIDKALKLFDSDTMLQKAIQYAMTPSKKKKFRFREVQSNQQDQQIQINEAEQNNIRFSEVLDKSDLHKKSVQKSLTHANIVNLKKLQRLTQSELINQDKQSRMFRKPAFYPNDGPIDDNDDQTNAFMRFLQNEYTDTSSEENKVKVTEQSTFQSEAQAGEGSPLPPVLVKIFNNKDPDPKIATAMEELEKGRDKVEQAMFKKATLEMKLISKQTLEELAQNMNAETEPFIAATGGTAKTVAQAVASILGKGRFLQRNRFRQTGRFFRFKQVEKYKLLNKKKQKNFLQIQVHNHAVHQLDTSHKSQHRTHLSNKDQEKSYEKENEKTEFNSQVQSQEQNQLQSQDTNQVGQTAGADSINVKLATSDVPYPTIYKLISEMEARRDLSEKFERLKILEFEMNLQKAQDEMIKDALHNGLQKVMDKYGPAIEGAQENQRIYNQRR